MITILFFLRKQENNLLLFNLKCLSENVILSHL